MDLGEQRALQDWYVKFALQTVPGVAEVASFGGFEKQYQLVLDPLKMQYYKVSMMEVMNAVKANNNDVGGRKFEMSDMSYIIRGLGYIKNIKDVEEIAIKNYNSIPVRVKDIGSIQMGGDLRLGIFDENGTGEVVGGIVVMRYGENADKVIKAVKAKMKEVEKGLPEGVTFKTSYDRSELIEKAIESVKGTLLEEMIAVSIVIIAFSFSLAKCFNYFNSIAYFRVCRIYFARNFWNLIQYYVINGNCLAIGVVVDDGIVMVENAYRTISEKQEETAP